MTTPQTADPDWLTEGSAVAEYSSRNMDGRVSFTTIERITATQIVCASGNRYRRSNCRIVGGANVELRAVNDPTVRNVVALRTVGALRHPLDQLLANLRADEPGLLAILDRIEEMVAEARAKITDSPPAVTFEVLRDTIGNAILRAEEEGGEVDRAARAVLALIENTKEN